MGSRKYHRHAMGIIHNPLRQKMGTIYGVGDRGLARRGDRHMKVSIWPI